MHFSELVPKINRHGKGITVTENYEYSRVKVSSSNKTERRKARKELVVSILFILALVAGYLSQHVFHWF